MFNLSEKAISPGFISLQIKQHFNYSHGVSLRRNFCKFNVLHFLKSCCVSQQEQYSSDALIYLQAHPIIHLAKRIITRLCAKSVY